MTFHQLHRLVIKPTLSCTANCPFCALRLELFEKRKLEHNLSCEQWVEVIEDAKKLGCRKLDISGGEPSLYPDLDCLILTSTRLGMVSNVNTSQKYLNFSV